MPVYRLGWMVLVYALGAVGAAVTVINAPWGAVVAVAAASAVIFCLASVASRGRTSPIGSPQLLTTAMVGAAGGLAILGSAAFVGLVGLVTAVLLVALSPPGHHLVRLWRQGDPCGAVFETTAVRER